MFTKKTVSFIRNNSFSSLAMKSLTLRSFNPHPVSCSTYYEKKFHHSSQSQFPSNSIVAFDSKFMNEDDYINLLNLSPSQGSLTKFMEIMKQEKKFDKYGIMNIIKNFFPLRDSLGTLQAKMEVTSSYEFTKLIKALYTHVPEMDVNNLALSFTCISWFHYPASYDLLELIASKILKDTSDLTFQHAVLFLGAVVYHYNDAKSDFKKEIIEELKYHIENEFLKNSSKFSSMDLAAAIKYVKLYHCSYWSDEALIILLNSCLGNEEVCSKMNTLAYCLTVRHFVKDKEKSEKYKKIILRKLQSQINQDRINVLFSFLRQYSHLILKKREPFNEEIYSALMESFLTQKISLKKLRNIIFSNILSSHVTKGLQKNILPTFDMPHHEFFQNFSSKKEYLSYFHYSLEFLSCLNVEEEIGWPIIKSKIEALRILSDVEEWMSVDLGHYLSILMSLASLNIFPNKALDVISEKINSSRNFTNSLIRFEKLSILTLNQAIVVLHPNYSKLLLSEDAQSAIVTALAEDDEKRPKQSKLIIDDFKTTLESIIPNQNCMLMHQYTRLKQHARMVIAVNSKGEFFDFSSALSNNEKFYLEDLIIPNEYKIIIPIFLLESHYCRNLFTLKPLPKLRVKTLKAMGYKPVTIFNEPWKNMSDSEKRIYLLEKFSEKT